MRVRLPLLLILLGYLLMGTLYAVYTPDWEAPDEPAHYNYVRQLAAGRLPRMEPDDYDQDFLEQVVFESHFAPQYDLSSIEYEDWQPPLYYLLQTPVFLLSGGSLLALRLFSLLVGAGVVAISYAVAGHLFPDRHWIALTAAVFVAFLPQHLAILASTNNDSLAELLIGAITLILIRWDAGGEDVDDASVTRMPQGRFRTNSRPAALVGAKRQHLTLGVLLGLGFLTKATVYPMAVLVALFLAVCYWSIRAKSDGRQATETMRSLWRMVATVFVPAILLGALWWGRNLIVYDGFDPLGTMAHDAVVTGQPRTAELVEQVGMGEAVRQYAQTTFDSFWGQFGWMTVPLPDRVYLPLGLFSGLIFIGLIARMVGRRAAVAPMPRLSALLLGGMFVLTVAVYIGYNFTYQQHQGRYLFPALVPIGIGVAVGLESWLNLLGRARTTLAPLIPAGLAIALLGLDVWALFRVILPALS